MSGTKIELPEVADTSSRAEVVSNAIIGIINAGGDREVTQTALQVFTATMNEPGKYTNVSVSEGTNSNSLGYGNCVAKAGVRY